MSKYSKPDVPCYGMISQSGGTYSVTFKEHDGITGGHSGYDASVFNKYKDYDFPIIDFRPCDLRAIARLVSKFSVEEVLHPLFRVDPGAISLEKYLRECESIGAIITNH